MAKLGFKPTAVDAKGSVTIDIQLRDGTVVTGHVVAGVPIEDRAEAKQMLTNYVLAYQEGREIELAKARTSALDQDLGKSVQVDP